MPKVTIIIPVYNVEKYLRQCLDSVVNQTLRDIEIICVNDGSPDGSPQILEEYAARDSRITVIHKENGGLSSARNAAFPYIKGEYTLFVDSDDWIEPDLCEKAVMVSERENADMTFFLYRKIPNHIPSHLELFLKKEASAFVNIDVLLKQPNVWSKLWKSDFIRNHNLYFPEGLCYEDLEPHWKALLQLPKTFIIPEKLYYYRHNPNSIMNKVPNGHVTDIVICYERIKELLQKNGQYNEIWKTRFLVNKLYMIASLYQFHTSLDNKPLLLESIKQTLQEDEITFLRDSYQLLPWTVGVFYDSINGSKLATIELVTINFLRQTKRIMKQGIFSIQENLKRAG
ncbi:MAG: glycosyltransferase [Bacteroidales bacterium]|jgi:glycosyltransferase involved in cell wall biosynthesis|nr:glycosyltransferase [Bacteroidales bacterium]